MTLAALLTSPVTITRRLASGTLDDYGNDVPTESVTETVGELQQNRRGEPGSDAETSITDWLLILPAGEHLSTADLITVDGQGYEVIGDPWEARNPRTGLPSHIEATVRRAGGSDDEGAS